LKLGIIGGSREVINIFLNFVTKEFTFIIIRGEQAKKQETMTL
jgi:hypothetical protein